MGYEVRETGDLTIWFGSHNQAFCEYIYGRREKERGKEKQDLSNRQRKDGIKHGYTRTLNENREAGFECTAEETL